MNGGANRCNLCVGGFRREDNSTIHRTRRRPRTHLFRLPRRRGAWKWSGTFSDKAVELLILGDIQIHSRRADPTTAFHRMRDTLKKADLVYANLEGLLVKSVGTTIDIPDKPEWTHPGPDGVKGLKAANIAIVGVANNVASGRDNIMKSLAVLDANGILHAGCRPQHRRGPQAGDRDAQRRQDRLPAIHRALVPGQGHDRDRHRGRRREDHVAGRRHDRSRGSRAR